MKQPIEKLILLSVVVCSSMLIWAADFMPRSEWHAKVGDCVQNPTSLNEIITKVSPEEQVALVAEINEAISTLPGSDEVKAARYYEVSLAAIRGAAKGNLVHILAEIFATVPLEYLTDLNERFSMEIFNRSANMSHPLTDDQFIQLSTNSMNVIVERCDKVENAAARETFAVLMFLRSSGGTPKDLTERLVATFTDEKGREMALKEWIKPAMGDGQEQSYDPILGVAQAGDEPDHAIVTSITGPADVRVAMLSDLAAESSVDMKTPISKLGAKAFQAPHIAGTGEPDIGLNRIPRAYIVSKKWVGGNAEGAYQDQYEEAGGSSEDGGISNPYYQRRRGDRSGYIPKQKREPTPEPTPYDGQ